MSHKPACRLLLIALLFTPAARAAEVFELRVGQGLSLKDAKAAAGGGDVKLVYLEKTLPTFKNHFNNLTGQVETRPVPGRQVEAAALTAKRVKLFKDRPDVTKMTTGDLADAEPPATLSADDKFAVVQTEADAFWLLSIKAAALPPAAAKDVRLTVSAEKIDLARGAAGGVALAKLPGRIVYVDRVRDVFNLFACDLAGGERKTIAENVGATPRVSRDGKTIAYQTPGDDKSITFADAAGKKTGTLKVPCEEIRAWDLSPSGKRVAVELVRLDKTESRERVLVVYDASGNTAGEFPNYRQPAMVDDDRLVCAGDVATPGIVVADIAKGTAKSIDAEAFDPSEMTISPDGVSLAVKISEKVHLMRLDGTQKRLAADTAGEIQERPAFSPDGKYLAYVSINRTLYSLPRPVKLIDLKTGKVSELIDAKGQPIHPVFDSTLTWAK